MYDSIIKCIPDIKGEYFPDKKEDIFRAFKYFYYKTETKLLILGQDPYNSKIACGLAFGQYIDYPNNSLKNILDELNDDLELKNNEEYADLELESWAKQGILLLNTALTIGRGKVSHINEWHNFIITVLYELPDTTVCLCLGAKAKSLCDRFVNKVCVPHPSPMNTSVPFRGSKPFSKVNILLSEQKIKIDWSTVFKNKK